MVVTSRRTEMMVARAGRTVFTSVSPLEGILARTVLTRRSHRIRLFRPEGDDRIHTSCAPCGDEAREQSDREKHNRDSGECEWIGRRHAVKQTNHDAR